MTATGKDPRLQLYSVMDLIWFGIGKRNTCRSAILVGRPDPPKKKKLDLKKGEVTPPSMADANKKNKKKNTTAVIDIVKSR